MRQRLTLIRALRDTSPSTAPLPASLLNLVRSKRTLLRTPRQESLHIRSIERRRWSGDRGTLLALWLLLLLLLRRGAVC